jgi:FKBP12-rapamycin complex-associated protein
LQQHEAALGILTFAQKNHFVELKEEWYEMLQRWNEAYDVYDKKEILESKDTYEDESEKKLQEVNILKNLMGKMRCLNALGEWKKLYELCLNSWKKYENIEVRKILSSMSASVCWKLNKWELFSEIGMIFTIKY